MITYQTGLQWVDWSQLTELYGQVGLVAGFGKKREGAVVRKAFTQSYRVVTAWDGKQLVGAARMISDGICYGVIYDVGVLPEYQHRGIGRGLMENLIDGLDDLHLDLTSTFGNEGFYASLGFKRHKTAMAKYPQPSEYLEEFLTN